MGRCRRLPAELEAVWTDLRGLGAPSGELSGNASPARAVRDANGGFDDGCCCCCCCCCCAANAAAAAAAF